MATFQRTLYSATVDRFGVETGSITWHADTLSEAREVGDATIGGVPMTQRQISPSDKDPQTYMVTLSYEGQATDGKPPGQEINESVEGEALFVQEPIELHPSIGTLLEKFNGYRDPADGTVKFAPTLGSGKPSAGTGLSAGGKASSPNPLAGRKTFAVAGCEVLHTYVRDQLPSDLFDDLNAILDNLPGSLPSNGRPSTPRGRNWMKMAPRWISRGNVVQIIDRYRLSPPGGFNKELYLLFLK